MSQVDHSEVDSQELAQLDSDIDSVNDEEMGDLVAEFLAQIDEDQKQQLQTLVAQVKANQYDENGEIILAQGENGPVLS